MYSGVLLASSYWLASTQMWTSTPASDFHIYFVFSGSNFVFMWCCFSDVCRSDTMALSVGGQTRRKEDESKVFRSMPHLLPPS